MCTKCPAYISLMNRPRSTPKEPMLNIEEPAPALLAIILVLAHLGYVLAPNSLKELFFTASSLQASSGNVFLEGRPLGTLATLFLHTLTHADWMHVVVNAGLIFAFGTIAIRATKNRSILLMGRIKRGPAAFLGIFLLGALLGGLMQWLVWSVTNDSGVAVGASTGGAALFAAAGWALGGKERMLSFIVLMMLVDFVSIFTGMGNPAWGGHFGGFLAGAILSPLWLRPASAGMHIFR